jgi:hypothetical protein
MFHYTLQIRGALRFDRVREIDYLADDVIALAASIYELEFTDRRFLNTHEKKLCQSSSTLRSLGSRSE